MLELRQELNASDQVRHSIEDVLAVGRTAWQRYLFFRSRVHGVCIALDGDLQSCEADEGLYHEALVHPALLAHPSPRRVLVMGGGEGATVREVLRHPNVREVVMVDLDEEFVGLCKRLIPSWAAGAWDDPRLELRHEDIAAYLEHTPGGFDVVVGDLIDASEEDAPAAALYSEAFYRKLAQAMAPGGLLATQAGPLTPAASSGHRRVRRELGKVFDRVLSYGMSVPSFYNLWGFVLAGPPDLLPGGYAEVRALFELRSRERGLELVHTGPEALAAAFAIPQRLQASLQEEA